MWQQVRCVHTLNLVALTGQTVGCMNLAGQLEAEQLCSTVKYGFFAQHSTNSK